MEPGWVQCSGLQLRSTPGYVQGRVVCAWKHSGPTGGFLPQDSLVTGTTEIISLATIPHFPLCRLERPSVRAPLSPLGPQVRLGGRVPVSLAVAQHLQPSQPWRQGLIPGRRGGVSPALWAVKELPPLMLPLRSAIPRGLLGRLLPCPFILFSDPSI